VLDSPDDLDGLISSLNTLAQNPALVAKMGDAARKRMESDFDSRVHIKKLVDLFQSKSPEVIPA
jgi:glycosyltransferase involved in cell wall biosynthesis